MTPNTFFNANEYRNEPTNSFTLIREWVWEYLKCANVVLGTTSEPMRIQDIKKYQGENTFNGVAVSVTPLYADTYGENYNFYNKIPPFFQKIQVPFVISIICDTGHHATTDMANDAVIALHAKTIDVLRPLTLDEVNLYNTDMVISLEFQDASFGWTGATDNNAGHLISIINMKGLVNI